MSWCPFMSKGKDPNDWCGCITSCELRINNTCAIKVLALKALRDAKAQQLDTEKRNDNATDSGT